MRSPNGSATLILEGGRGLVGVLRNLYELHCLQVLLFDLCHRLQVSLDSRVELGQLLWRGVR